MDTIEHACRRIGVEGHDPAYSDDDYACVQWLSGSGVRDGWYLGVPYDCAYAQTFVSIDFCPFCGEKLP